MSDSYAQFLDQVDAAAMDRQGRGKGAEIKFRCPMPEHEDEHPSSFWNRSKAGWNCKGCDGSGGARDLAKLLGIEPPPPPGVTLVQFAEAKGLPVDFLRSAGLRDTTYKGRPAIDMPYIDENGATRATRKRLALDKGTGGDERFAFSKDSKLILYGLPALHAARDLDQILIVEGESDQLTLRHAGILSVGVPGATNWKPEWATQLADVARVLVWHEPDGGGDALVQSLREDFPELRVIEAPPEATDPSELWAACGYNLDDFRTRMQTLALAARPASEIRAEALSTEARDVWALAEPLLTDPDLIDRIKDAIKDQGYAGSLIPPTLGYLAITSRFLERPMNLAFVAPSSAGKSFAVDTPRALMPESATYYLKSGSERALIFNEVDYEHKALIIGEADSIPEDGPGASAIRSIAADNYMEYEITEKGENGQHTTRTIRKPGPTGVITTSTRQLPPQMSTRMLTVSITDTEEQIRDVLRAQADRVNGARSPGDPARFIAAQRWLELVGVHEVTIPFSHVLADEVVISLVRMTRDFRQLLTVIQTVALLYQCQRQRDDRGRVVATVDDYRVAYDLIGDVFTASATGGSTAAVRATVNAVAELCSTGTDTCAIVEIATRLGIAQDATWHRVRRAIRGGWLVNDARKGHKAEIKLGDPLPERRSALPTPEELAAKLPSTPETNSYVHTAGETYGAAIWDGSDIEGGSGMNTPNSSPIHTRSHPADEPYESGMNPGDSYPAEHPSQIEPAVVSVGYERMNSIPEGEGPPYDEGILL